MGAHLDLDDLAADWPLAKTELAQLRQNDAAYRWLRANTTGIIELRFGHGFSAAGTTADFDAQVAAEMRRNP
jgi:hypothetical protein